MREDREAGPEMRPGDGPYDLALVGAHRVRGADLAERAPPLRSGIAHELIGELIHGHLSDLRWIRRLQVVEILEVSAGDHDVHAGSGRDRSQSVQRGFLAP